MSNQIVLSKSTALNIADILQVYMDSGNNWRKDIDNYIKELRGEL